MRAATILILAATLLAQDHWPQQLETDVKTQRWDAAVRVGAALIDEIEAGRIFARFADVPQETSARRLYAEALEHTGQSLEAKRQRAFAGHPDSIAAEYANRVANLKADLLATEINQPASFPRAGNQVLIVNFWADWCAPCKPQRAQLNAHQISRAKLLEFDVDHLDPAMRPYVQLESLQSAALPQLYIVDPVGRIRFHITGYQDRFFIQKLDWMIEAALHEPARFHEANR